MEQSGFNLSSQIPSIPFSAIELEAAECCEPQMPREVGANAASIVDREALILEHLPSVRHMARQLHRKLPRQIDLEDLVSAGVLGLMDACARFDESRHVQFKSFAQFRIRGAILDSLRVLDWSPRELRRKRRAVQAAAHVMGQRLGRTPAEHEIAAELKMELKDFQKLLRELNGLEIDSLNAEHAADSETEAIDFIAAAPDEDPLFRLLEGETKNRLVEAIERLPERERLVLTLYYHEELSLKEIGFTLGVVESRVSQIRSTAVQRLRKALGAGSIRAKKADGMRERSGGCVTQRARSAA